MNPPRVLNRALHGLHHEAVYVGRPSKWGNPWRAGRDGTTAEVIARYRHYVVNSPLANDLPELAGRDLVCWCAPYPCHADVLLELANGLGPG